MGWAFVAGLGGTNDPYDTLVQTGTDTDLSGLIAVTGGSGAGDYFTTQTKGLKTVYIQDIATSSNFTLRIEGTLTLDPEIEELWFDNAANTNQLGANLEDKNITIASGGTFNVGIQTTVNGVVRYSQGDAIICQRDHRPQFSINFIEVLSGGAFVHNGGTIYGGNASGVRAGGTAVINAGRYVNLDSNASAQFMRVDDSVQLTIGSVELDSQDTDWPLVLYATNGLSNVTGLDFRAAAIQNRNGAWTGAMQLSNLEFSRNAADYDVEFFATTATETQIQPVELFNVDVGSATRAGQSDGNNSKRGHLAVFQEVDHLVQDTLGNPVNLCRFVMTSTDNGNRSDDLDDKFRNDRIFTGTAFDSYSNLSNTSGIIAADFILLATKWDSSQASQTIETNYYNSTNTDGADVFTFVYWSLAFNVAQLVVDLKGASKKTLEPVLVLDPDVTETNPITVLLYTTIESPEKMYNASKVWKAETQANAQYPDVLTALMRVKGKTLATDHGIQFLDLTVSTTTDFVVDTAGAGEIQVNAQGEFLTTSNFDTLTSLESINIADETDIEGWTFDAVKGVIFDDPQNLRDFTAASGTVVEYQSATPSAVSWDGCNIGSFENSSTGTITISLLNSTPVPGTITNSGAGAVTVFQRPVTVRLNDPIVGSRIAIIAGAGGPETEGTVLENVVSTSVTEDFTHLYVGNQPVIVRIRKATLPGTRYETFETTGTIGITGLELNIFQNPDE